MPEVASIVLFSHDFVRTVAFYRALGVDFEDEDHGDGLLHAATDVGDVHIAVFPSASDAGSEPPAPAWRASGSTFVGFYVPSLDEAAASVRALGAKLLLDHQLCEWGCRVVAEDPDGRAVEINQRGHCAGPELPGLWARLLSTKGVEESPSMFSERPALWVNGKEIAHRDVNGTFDVRLTRGVIKELRTKLRSDPRVRLRPSSSADWVEVTVANSASENLLAELVERAADAHRPAPGSVASRPPQGEALARRRGFH